MNLIKEKERLFEIASNSDDKITFETINRELKSYYIPYNHSKHTDSVLEYYESQELSDIQKRLESLWSSNESLSAIIPIILIAYKKSRTVDTNYLREIEVHNYMM